jgi:hypothetical protein
MPPSKRKAGQSKRWQRWRDEHMDGSVDKEALLSSCVRDVLASTITNLQRLDSDSGCMMKPRSREQIATALHSCYWNHEEQTQYVDRAMRIEEQRHLQLLLFMSVLQQISQLSHTTQLSLDSWKQPSCIALESTLHAVRMNSGSTLE